MKDIQIKNRWGEVIISGKYGSIKDAIEKNLGADLTGADLSGANLTGADLTGADLRGANLTGADLRDADLYGADLSEAHLTGADLSGANLTGADLREADLSEAHLSEANLSGAKGYMDSHDFFAETIQRQKAETFTSVEWSAIGQIMIHRLCWDSIKKRHKTAFIRITNKLAKAGFDGWQEYIKENW